MKTTSLASRLQPPSQIPRIKPNRGLNREPSHPKHSVKGQLSLFRLVGTSKEVTLCEGNCRSKHNRTGTHDTDHTPSPLFKAFIHVSQPPLHSPDNHHRNQNATTISMSYDVGNNTQRPHHGHHPLVSRHTTRVLFR